MIGEDDQERTGGDLLFRGLSRSTIGAVKFHGRVRDGIGWDLHAIATSSLLIISATEGRHREAYNSDKIANTHSVFKMIAHFK